MIAGEQYLTTIYLFGNYAIAHMSLHTYPCTHVYIITDIIAILQTLSIISGSSKLFLFLIILSASLLFEFKFHTLLHPLWGADCCYKCIISRIWMVSYFITHKMFHNADGHMLYVKASHASTFFFSQSLKTCLGKGMLTSIRGLSHESRVFSCHGVSLVGDLTPGHGL